MKKTNAIIKIKELVKVYYEGFEDIKYYEDEAIKLYNDGVSLEDIEELMMECEL